MTLTIPLRALSDLVVDGDVSYGIVQPGHHSSGGVPIVRVGDVRNGKVDTSTPLRVHPSIEQKHRRTRLEGGEVLLTIVGSVGETALVPLELSGWNVARAVAVLRPKDIPADWLRLCLNSVPVKRQMSNVLNTTVQATLNLRDLKNLQIPTPPIAHINRVLEVVGALEAKISSNTRLATVIEDYCVTALQVSNSWIELGQACTIQTTLRKPSQMKSDLISLFSIPAFDGGKLPAIERPESVQSSKFLIERPCVLVSKLNPRIPRVWDVATIGNLTSYSSNEFLVLEPTYGSTTTLAASIANESVFEQIRSLVAGTSGSHQRVKPSDLITVKIPDVRALPKTHADAIESLGKRLGNLRAESQMLRDLRDTLIPGLMTGSLRVRDFGNAAENACNQTLGEEVHD